MESAELRDAYPHKAENSVKIAVDKLNVIS